MICMVMGDWNERRDELKRVECYYENDFGDEYPAYIRETVEGDFYIAEEVDEEIGRLKREGICPAGYRLQPIGEFDAFQNVLAQLERAEREVVYLNHRLDERDEFEAPACFCAHGWHNGGKIFFPGYANETIVGVKSLVLEAARKEGYKGTIEGRLMDLDWGIAPLYEATQPHNSPDKRQSR